MNFTTTLHPKSKDYGNDPGSSECYLTTAAFHVCSSKPSTYIYRDCEIQQDFEGPIRDLVPCTVYLFALSNAEAELSYMDG